MIECPYCYRVFRQPPEKLGARCPKCKMPFYEDPVKRRKNPEKDHGPCSQHPESPGVTRCTRCERPICQTCRTRWHEEPVCPRCVENSIGDDEPSPREAHLQSWQAWAGLILGLGAWGLMMLTLAPLSQQARTIYVFMTYFFFLGSMLPATFGLAHAYSAIRLRGDHGKLAAIGLVSAASQLGLAIGIIVINLWHN